MPSNLQLNRLIKRDRITPEQAAARIRAQMPIGEICNRADVVVKNKSSFADLQKQIFKAMNGRWFFEQKILSTE